MNEELKVIISANADALKKGCQDAANEIQGLDKKSSGAGDKVKKVFDGMGKAAVAVGKAVGTAMAAAGTAIVAVGKQALEQYSSFEQLEGGIKKLYKGAADDVMQYASQAYKTTGMTTNQYMEMASSFAASLTSALNGNVKKSAEVTNMAVNDMADNASVFGTSMESIQSAYNGFAKQNYTMLDNLKLGYGGTKTEMERLLADAEKISGVKYDINNLSDVYNAIHEIQNEMKITGNAADEASRTIEGSINATKAAWTNLLTGLMNENANIPQLVSNLCESGLNVLNNVKPRIKQFADSIPKVIKTAMPTLLSTITDIISTVLPVVINGAVGILDAIVGVLPQLTSALLGALPQLINGFTQIVNGLIGALPQMVQIFCAALPSILPALINGLVSMIVTLCSSIGQIIQPLIDNLPMIITSIVGALIENLPALIDGVIQLVLGIVGAADQIISTLVPMIPTIMMQIVAAIIKEIPTLLAGVVKLCVALAKSVKDWYASWIAGFAAAFGKIITKVADFFKNLGKDIQEAWEKIKTQIKEKVESIKEAVKEKFEAMKTAIHEKVEAVKTGVKEKFEAIKSAITEKVESAKAAVKDKFEQIKSGITEKVNAVKTTVTNTFNAVKTAITSPVEKARDAVKTVVDKIKGFFHFTWSLPKLKVPHFSITPSGWKVGDLLKGSIPKLGVTWNAKGGVFDTPTLFAGNGGLQGLGEDGPEAVVPLEKNTKWLDRIADKLNANSQRPVYLTVKGKVFAETTIDALNDYTRQTGSLPLVIV